MKQLIVFLLAAIFTSLLLSPQSIAQNSCDGSLWKYVYHQNRFTKLADCKTVTGIIMEKVKEADGDYHLQLKLDAGQSNLLNQKNINRQKGNLVLEIICKGTITQADAKTPCKGCPKNIAVPKKGAHVKVTGTYVTDNESNHGWNEIHPVYDIQVLP